MTKVTEMTESLRTFLEIETPLGLPQETGDPPTTITEDKSKMTDTPLEKEKT